MPLAPECGQCPGGEIVRERLERLTTQQASLESQVRIVAAGHAQLADQIANITLTLREQDRLIADNAQRMGGIADALKENTELTKGIRDAVTTGRVLRRLAVWLGGAAIVVAQWWDQIKPHLHK